jgi:DNA polymerase-3 subunit delta
MAGDVIGTGDEGGSGGPTRAASGRAGGGKKEPLRPAYLILGDDEPKVERALQRLRGRIVQESGTDLNLDEFDASRHDARTVLAAANTLAFLGGLRLVLVHGIDAWRKPDKDEIVAYLRLPAPDACLALVGKKLPPQDALRRAIAGVGEILEYTAPKSWQMPEWIHEQARRMGVHLELAEARLLVQRVGDGQQVLLREVEKLGMYRGRARVTAEDVVLLSTRSLEASIFDLVDAVSTRQGARAFTALEELYAAGERPAGLHIRLMRHFQQLTRVVALRAEGWPATQIQAELKVKPYAAKKLMQQSQRYSAATVTLALAALADTDARLKGMGDLPEHLELELCLGSLLGLEG